MPIPVPNAEAPAPRRLLRDVVFDKMLEAIADGTLELGERLNDDELVSWLGVSRTPVREAIARLADYGLVDIEANRYTRVVSPTIDDFADTTATAFDVWGIVARRGVPKLNETEATAIVASLKSIGRDAKGKLKAGSITKFSEAMDVLVAASGSSSLARLLETVSDRAMLFFGLASAEVAFSVAGPMISGLSAAIPARDGDAAQAAFQAAFDGMGDYVSTVEEAGVFPATSLSR